MHVHLKSILKTFLDWFAKTNVLLYSVIFAAVVFVVQTVFSIFEHILKVLDIQFKEKLVNENFEISIDLLVDTLFIAPLLETFIFQFLFFFIFTKFNVNRWVIITLSGISFGVYHNYSLLYMLHTFVIGIIFMYLYIKRAERDNRPFISNVSAHFTVNLCITLAVIIAHFCKKGLYLA